MAMGLDTLSTRLSALRRHEEARSAAQKAVNVWRDLEVLRRDAHLEDYAQSLTGLAAEAGALSGAIKRRARPLKRQ